MKRVDPNTYPPGLNLKKVRDIIEFYDNQSEEDAVAEIEEGLAIKAGNHIVCLETALSKRILDLAKEKKTTVEKLLNSMLRKNLAKAA